MEKNRTQWNRIVQNSVPQNRMEYNGIEYNYFTSNTCISIIDHKCGNIPLTCHKHKVPLILFSIPDVSNKRVFVKCFACNVFVLTFLTVKDIAWYLFSDTCHCCCCCQDWGLHCSAVALCRPLPLQRAAVPLRWTRARRASLRHTAAVLQCACSHRWWSVTWAQPALRPYKVEIGCVLALRSLSRAHVRGWVKTTKHRSLPRQGGSGAMIGRKKTRTCICFVWTAVSQRALLWLDGRGGNVIRDVPCLKVIVSNYSKQRI